MPREPISITIDDVSSFTKSLRRALTQSKTLPGHATMLGLVARAAGYQNFQQARAAAPSPKGAQPDLRLQKALRVFENGVMQFWPSQTSVQGLCLWAFWAHFPARTDLSEHQVNDILKSRHSFGDHALLRRSLIDHRLVHRTTDGRIYRRIEQVPPPQAAELIARVEGV